MLAQTFRVDPLEFHMALVFCSCMDESLNNGLVRIFQFDIFSDQPDLHFFLGVFQLTEKFFPVLQVRFALKGKSEFFEHHLIQSFILHQNRNCVDGLGVQGFHDGFFAHVTELGQFPLDVVGQVVF